MAEPFSEAPQVDGVERAAENVQAEDVQFRREWFYVTAAVLAWRVFWELADRNQDNVHTQHMAWIIVFVAVWLANTF